MTNRFILLAAACAIVAFPAEAQRRRDVTPERPQVLNDLTACRAIAAEAERLACYDRQVAALEAAEASRAIAVVDRQQIRRTRRSLFGLTLPDLGIFGGDDDEGEDGAAVNEINTTIRSVGSGADGRMVYGLEDNSVWVQTEGRIGRQPRAGEAIRIRRGPLGSFIANVGTRSGGPASYASVKVRHRRHRARSRLRIEPGAVPDRLQCRCGPVARPVMPTRPIRSPCRTIWPGRTLTLERCRKALLKPMP